MSLSNILEWGFLFLLIGIGIYTLVVIKNEKIKFKNRILSFKKYKILIPDIWQEVVGQDDNELHFSNNDLDSMWECLFLWLPNAKKSGVEDIFGNIISNRKIIFDDSTIVNPTIKMLRKDFEILRIEGSATIDRIERHYCDCFLIHQKETDEYLYAESRGPILNGFLMAYSFEETISTLSFPT